MKRLKAAFLFFFLTTILYVATAGWLLDATDRPKKADVIAVLGGDWEGRRAKKALQLFEKGYATRRKILVNIWQSSYIKDANGSVYRTEKAFLLAHGLKKNEVESINAAGHTMNEIEFLKDYMLRHRYHSLIVVTEPPHTARVKMLTHLAHYHDANITLLAVGTDAPWWHKWRYLGNCRARRYVLMETLKIPFNFVMYGILEPTGLLDALRPWLHEPVNKLKEKTIHWLE